MGRGQAASPGFRLRVKTYLRHQVTIEPPVREVDPCLGPQSVGSRPEIASQVQ